jgi:hypothetical protein
MIYLLLSVAMASPMKTYTYLDLNNKTFQIQSNDFKIAARMCFFSLTGGKYQGEEKGLDIIDRCANPVKVK